MDADWTSSAFRQALLAMVQRRIPARDAEDVVQAVLSEAVASDQRPTEPENARRWIWGVARNKVADYHRRARREVLDADPEAAPTEHAIDDLLHWAVGELPEGADARRTFEWLLREGDGEKLEEIADREALPAAQVRQRVSRLRRFFRSRWALRAAALLVLVAIGLYVGRRRTPQSPRVPEIMPSPEIATTIERARRLRDDALRACDRSEWAECERGLDDAQRLDPGGEALKSVRRAREQIRRTHAPTIVPDVVNPPPAPGPSWMTNSFDSSMGSDPSWSPPRRRRAPRRTASDAGVGMLPSIVVPVDAPSSP